MRHRYTDANTHRTPNDNNKALLSQRKKGSSRIQAHTTNTSKYVSDHICTHRKCSDFYGGFENTRARVARRFSFRPSSARTATLEHSPYNFNLATCALKTFHSESFSACSHPSFRISNVFRKEQTVECRGTRIRCGKCDIL